MWPTPEEKFWANVIFTNHGLEWTGSKRGSYGRTRINGNQVTVHRLAWELIRGPLPNNAILDHASNCPKTCVTPGHMLIHYSRADHARAGWTRGEYDNAWVGRSTGPRDPVTGRFVGRR